MAIPDFQYFLRPVLECLSDRKAKANKQIRKEIINIHSFTNEELEQKLPSDSTGTIASRIDWSITYLYKAGLIYRVSRGVYEISDKGIDFLQKHEVIRIKELLEIDSFREFQRPQKSTTHASSVIQPEVDFSQNELSTPIELIAKAANDLRNAVTSELLDMLKTVTPSFFEKIVVELLVKMGYGGSFQDAARVIGKSGDGGIDGVIKEDKLGLDVIYVQAKRWEGTVGRPEIQKFVGALIGTGAKKGIFITTSTYTKEALEYHSGDLKLVKIDGLQLVDLMFEYGLGVNTKETYVVKNIDSDYLEE
jgi:restriction system protein